MQYQQSLLQGLPLEAQSVSYSTPSTLSQLAGGDNAINTLLNRYGLGSLFGGSSDTVTEQVTEKAKEVIGGGE